MALGWDPWADVEVTYLDEFKDGCRKSCIEALPGTKRALPDTCWLALYSLDQIRYTELQRLEPTRYLWMTCGGKTYWDETLKNHSVDSLYWSDQGNNIAPSCGKVIALEDLEKPHEKQKHGWVRNPRSEIWWCPVCDREHSCA